MHQPPSGRPAASDLDDRLDAVVTEYLKAVEAGQRADRRTWIAGHPELAEALGQFFGDLDCLNRVTGPSPVADSTPSHPVPSRGGGRGQSPGQDKTCSYLQSPHEDSPGIPVDKRTPRPTGPQPPRAGRFGDYELLGEIARGGMGVVYRARQVSVNRVVALKMILGSDTATPVDLQRFRNEAEAAAILDHPNIIPIHEVGSHAGHPFFTMRLVEGGSLADRLPCGDAQRRPLVALLAQVCRAVHFAHRHGVLHRDLKPGNILISERTEERRAENPSGSATAAHGLTAVVTDFGLAKLTRKGNDLTQSGAIVGTPCYAAPEQARGNHQAVTTAADVYSLGVILYEIVAGRVPFRGATVLDTILLVLERDPVPPRRLNPRVDADLETICLKCLEKDPARRYESAEALAEELDRWLAGEPIRARPTSVPNHVWRLARRKPQLAAIAGLVILLAGSAPVAGWEWYQSRVLAAAEASARNDAEAARIKAEAARIKAEAARAASAKAEARARAAEERAQVQTFRAVFGQAESQWRFHNVPRAAELLARCRQSDRFETLRGWEWDYLDRQCHPEEFTAKLHNGAGVLWGSFCDGGRKMATLGFDNTLRVSDARTGAPCWSAPSQADWGVTGAVSPDGRLVAVPTSGGKTPAAVRVLEAATGAETVVLKGLTGLTHGLAFSPDGKRLAAAEVTRGVRVWDLATGAEERLIPCPESWCLMFSPDSRSLVVGCDRGTLTVFDPSTGATVRSTRAHRNAILGVAFRPGTGVLATASADETVKLWDYATGQPLGVLDHNGLVFCVAFSPDGNRLATPSCDMTIKVWDAATLKEAAVTGGHTMPVMGVNFSPQGDRLLSVSSDTTVRVWNAPESPEARVIRDAGPVRAAVFTSDGTGVVTCSDGETGSAARLWNVARGTLIRRFDGTDGPAFVSPDGKFVVAGVKEPANRGAAHPIRVWDVSTGRELVTLDGHPERVALAAFHPEGRFLTTAGYPAAAGAVQMTRFVTWDLKSGRAKASWEQPGRITHLAASPDGGHVALAGFSSPNPGNDAGGASRSTSRSRFFLLLVDAGTGRAAGSFKAPHAVVTAIGFSPDGKSLAAAEGMFANDMRVVIHDVAGRKPVASLRGHFGGIYGLTFAPDGRRLASAGYDRSVRVWDPVRAEEVLTLYGHTGHVRVVGFSPDGRRVISAGDDRTIRVWDGTPREPKR